MKGLVLGRLKWPVWATPRTSPCPNYREETAPASKKSLDHTWHWNFQPNSSKTSHHLAKTQKGFWESRQSQVLMLLTRSQSSAKTRIPALENLLVEGPECSAMGLTVNSKSIWVTISPFSVSIWMLRNDPHALPPMQNLLFLGSTAPLLLQILNSSMQNMKKQKQNPLKKEKNALPSKINIGQTNVTRLQVKFSGYKKPKAKIIFLQMQHSLALLGTEDHAQLYNLQIYLTQHRREGNYKTNLISFLSQQHLKSGQHK